MFSTADSCKWPIGSQNTGVNLAYNYPPPAWAAKFSASFPNPLTKGLTLEQNIGEDLAFL